MQRRIRKELFRNRTIALAAVTHWPIFFIFVITAYLFVISLQRMGVSLFEITGAIIWLGINTGLLGYLWTIWEEAAKTNLWLDDEGAKQGLSVDTRQGRIDTLIAKVKSENRRASPSKPPSGRDQIL